MKVHNFLCSIAIVAYATCAFGQVTVDVVYGDVSYAAEGDVEIISSLSYPVIDMPLNDSVNLMTFGIPPLVIGDNTVSTHSFTELEGISIFPNPVQTDANLTRSSASNELIVEVFSSRGELIHTQPWMAYSTQTNIDFRPLVPGSYFVRVADPIGQKLTLLKVVKLE